MAGSLRAAAEALLTGQALPDKMTSHWISAHQPDKPRCRNRDPVDLVRLAVIVEPERFGRGVAAPQPVGQIAGLQTGGAGEITEDAARLWGRMWGRNNQKSAKRLIYIIFFVVNGGLGRIRTPDPLIRSQVLYPTELPVRVRVGRM